VSPRTPEQNEEIRQARRQQILDAAVHVYMEKGVRGAEIGEIAEHAGVARGLVYHYYKDKLALFQDLFQQSLDGAAAFISSALNTGENPMVRLERYLRSYMESAIEQPHQVRFHKNIQQDITLVFEDRADEILRLSYEKLMLPLATTLQEAMDQGYVREMDPLLVMNVFWGSIMGAMNVFMHHPSADDLEKRKIDVITLVFQGIERNPAGKGDKHS
jgi:TetR/AcrR family transcriptional regulator